MATATVILEGTNNLARTLRIAGRKMADMEDENRNTASVIMRDALGRVPRKSGALAGSIRPEATKGEAITYAGSYSVPYAGPINYGWPAHNISAQPFLTTALTDTEPVWLRDYERSIKEACNLVRGA
jgi:phage gpG-like protein